MCGLAALFAYHQSAPPISEAELLSIREAMVSRGPDDAGTWLSLDGRVGLAHRRLSLLDPSTAGAQPMTDGRGSLVIVHNGEIYNYRELRAVLESRGRRLRSGTDTEVLLELYAEFGVEMLGRLRGMYAFAIWDRERCELFLARDPFGIKPLYYADDGKTLRVASQVKALLAGGAINVTPDPAGRVGFYLLGYVPEPFTLYQQIKPLPPGSWLRVTKGGGHEERTFCDIGAELAAASQSPVRISLREAKQRVAEAMRESVRDHLVADVPVGVFLSAGLDSAAVIALASTNDGSRLTAVTLGFDEYRGRREDETSYAAATARRCGAQHGTIWVRRQDFQSEFERFVAAMDQPTTDGFNTYLVSMAARRAGLKAALSGLGGDELFRGYPSFVQLNRIVGLTRWFPTHLLGSSSRSVLFPLVKRLASPKFAGFFEYGGTFGGAYLLRRALFMPWELDPLLDPHVVKQGLEALNLVDTLNSMVRPIEVPALKVMALETCWYMRNQLLRDADWAGMAHSVEIRVPLVDLRLLRTVAPIVAGLPHVSKHEFLGDILHSRFSPEAITRPKTGFNTPLVEWLSATGVRSERGLRGWARELEARFGRPPAGAVLPVSRLSNAAPKYVQ